MKNAFIIFIILAVLVGVALLLGGLQRSQLEESIVPASTPPPTPALHPANVPPRTVYNLSGTLLRIQGDVLAFGANVELTADGRQLIEEKVARITSSTKIVRFETVTNPETGRPRVEERPIALAELRPGDRIQVISNRDIRQQEEIQATKIRFLGRD